MTPLYIIIMLISMLATAGLYSELIMWIIVLFTILIPLISYSQLIYRLTAVTPVHFNTGFIFEKLHPKLTNDNYK